MSKTATSPPREGELMGTFKVLVSSCKHRFATVSTHFVATTVSTHFVATTVSTHFVATTMSTHFVATTVNTHFVATTVNTHFVATTANAHFVATAVISQEQKQCYKICGDRTQLCRNDIYFRFCVCRPFRKLAAATYGGQARRLLFYCCDHLTLQKRQAVLLH